MRASPHPAFRMSERLWYRLSFHPSFLHIRPAELINTEVRPFRYIHWLLRIPHERESRKGLFVSWTISIALLIIKDSGNISLAILNARRHFKQTVEKRCPWISQINFLYSHQWVSMFINQESGIPPAGHSSHSAARWTAPWTPAYDRSSPSPAPVASE